MSIDERIQHLENKFKMYPGQVSGTILTRVLTPTQLMWSLGLGGMSQPKTFFEAPTIEECLHLAEQYSFEDCPVDNF